MKSKKSWYSAGCVYIIMMIRNSPASPNRFRNCASISSSASIRVIAFASSMLIVLSAPRSRTLRLI